MGSETEPEETSTPKLPLLWSTPQPHTSYCTHSPPRSGTLTPPLYSSASASVPFRWEEEPGKPRSCTALSNPIDFGPKCLELPPRLFFLDGNNKLPSPTTVLEGPYMGRPRFQSSSFRIIRKECYGSFRRSFSPEREQHQQQLGSLVLYKRDIKDSKGLLGSWRWGRRAFRGKRENVGGASYVFPSSLDRDEIYCGKHKEEEEDDDDDEEQEEDDSRKKNVKITRIRRSGSFSSHARSHFWATIYEGLKQVVPWRSKKLKKEGFVIRQM